MGKQLENDRFSEYQLSQTKQTYIKATDNKNAQNLACVDERTL